MPIFRVLGGCMLVLAGLFAYYGVTFGSLAALIFVAAGVIALLVALAGHRPRGWDVAIFLVGILALSGVTAGYAASVEFSSYSASRAQVPESVIALVVSSSTGSVSVGFSNDTNLAYQVNFTRPAGVFFLNPPGEDTVTNSTGNGIFRLNVEAAASGVTVLLGKGYIVDINVSASTGSVNLSAAGGQSVRSASLTASLGSVNALVDSTMLQSLTLRSDTGSVSLSSDMLGAAGSGVPVSASTSTGSVSVHLTVAHGNGVSVSASTSLGTVVQDLPGFAYTQNEKGSVVASTGDLGAGGKSVAVTAATSLGSVSVSIHTLPA